MNHFLLLSVNLIACTLVLESVKLNVLWKLVWLFPQITRTWLTWWLFMAFLWGLTLRHSCSTLSLFIDNLSLVAAIKSGANAFVSHGTHNILKIYSNVISTQRWMKKEKLFFLNWFSNAHLSLNLNMFHFGPIIDLLALIWTFLFCNFGILCSYSKKNSQMICLWWNYLQFYKMNIFSNFAKNLFTFPPNTFDQWES